MDPQPSTASSLRSSEDAILLRIIIGDNHRYKHQPLYEALVLKAREMHLAGATVLKSPMGYGHHNKLHTAKILDLSSDLPLVVEIVDIQEKIDAFLPIVDEMMVEGGLVTMEKVLVMRCRTIDERRA